MYLPQHIISMYHVASYFIKHQSILVYEDWCCVLDCEHISWQVHSADNEVWITRTVVTVLSALRTRILSLCITALAKFAAILTLLIHVRYQNYFQSVFLKTHNRRQSLWKKLWISSHGLLYLHCKHNKTYVSHKPSELALPEALWGPCFSTSCFSLRGYQLSNAQSYGRKFA